jgi:ribosomal subunit interface protein
MAVSFVCERFSPTPSIQTSVDESVWSLSHFLPRIDDVNVYFSKNGHGFFQATLRIHAFHRTIIGRAINPDLYTALEDATKKVIRQVTDFKNKKLAEKRHNGRRIEVVELD